MRHENWFQLCKLLYTHSTLWLLAEQVQKLLNLLARQKAIKGNSPAAAERLERGLVKQEELRIKLERFDFRNDKNKTPLHLAAMSGSME